MKVIDLKEWREKNTPHLEGKGICLHCAHEWTAACPFGVFQFQCPKCNLFHGVFQSSPVPDRTYQCACGCVHFFVTSEGSFCARCADQKKF